MRELTLELPDADATAALGSALAASFPGAAHAGVVVHLAGDLGAGKTALARSFLAARGVVGPIRSPTYTLVETYALADATYVHVDLYRLQAGAELQELGLRDVCRAGHVILIEWPDRGGASLPRADLRIGLEDAGAGRRARLASRGEIGDAWLAMLASDRRILSYLPNLT